MSDNIPRFVFGNRVRVMQTSEMESAGLANRKGTVAANQRTPANLVSVALDVLHFDDEEQTVDIPSDSLMKI